MKPRLSRSSARKAPLGPTSGHAFDGHGAVAKCSCVAVGVFPAASDWSSRLGGGARSRRIECYSRHAAASRASFQFAVAVDEHDLRVHETSTAAKSVATSTRLGHTGTPHDAERYHAPTEVAVVLDLNAEAGPRLVELLEILSRRPPTPIAAQPPLVETVVISASGCRSRSSANHEFPGVMAPLSVTRCCVKRVDHCPLDARRLARTSTASGCGGIGS
jgi:hypothetical protein